MSLVPINYCLQVSAQRTSKCNGKREQRIAPLCVFYIYGRLSAAAAFDHLQRKRHLKTPSNECPPPVHKHIYMTYTVWAIYRGSTGWMRIYANFQVHPVRSNTIYMLRVSIAFVLYALYIEHHAHKMTTTFTNCVSEKCVRRWIRRLLSVQVRPWMQLQNWIRETEQTQQHRTNQHLQRRARYCCNTGCCWPHIVRL